MRSAVLAPGSANWRQDKPSSRISINNKGLAGLEGSRIIFLEPWTVFLRRSLRPQFQISTF